MWVRRFLRTQGYHLTRWIRLGGTGQEWQSQLCPDSPGNEAKDAINQKT